jgi:hypothetical protein
VPISTTAQSTKSFGVVTSSTTSSTLPL